MRRETALLYTADQDIKSLFDLAFNSQAVSLDVREGNIMTALQDIEAGEWVIAPDMVILCGTIGEQIYEALTQIQNSDNIPESEMEVIIIGTEIDPKYYRKVIDMGVADYIIHKSDTIDVLTDEIVEELVSRVLTNIRQKRFGINMDNIIAVTGSQGGSGASTIASAIAYSLAYNQSKTALVDTDIVHPTQFMFAGTTKPPKAYIDGLSDPSRIDAVLLKEMIINPVDNLAVFSGEFDFSGLDTELAIKSIEALPSGMDNIISAISDSFQNIIVDIPAAATPSPDYLGEKLLYGARRLVIVTEPTILGFRHLGRKLRLIKENGVANQEIFIVVNKTGVFDGGTLPLSVLEKEFGIQKSIYEVSHDPKLQVNIMNASPLFDKGSNFLTQIEPFTKSQILGEEITEVSAIKKFINWLMD